MSEIKKDFPDWLNWIILIAGIIILGAIIDFFEGPKNEPFEETYFNGKPKAKGNFKDDKYEGIVYQYYRNGYIEERSAYKEGIRQGNSKIFYNNGNLKFDANYKDGEIEGAAYTYYKNSTLLKEENYKNGDLGFFTVYYENGDIQERLHLTSGVSEYFEADEIVYEEFYVNGDISQVIRFIDKSLNQINKVSHFYQNGQLSSKFEIFNQQEKIYTAKLFYSDGTLESEGKLYLANMGINPEWNKNGLWKIYHTNGSLSSIISYKDDAEDGPYEIYSKDGKLISKGMFVEGTQKEGYGILNR